MPFKIVRNDITNMQVDAIVNSANPKPLVGAGVDFGIHKKAGPGLLEARWEIGRIEVGKAAVTPAFDLNAKYVIHAVGPMWLDGQHNEAEHLKNCYDNALNAAAEHGCESIAFPLISTGNYGFPKSLALQIAINAFSSFLKDHDMHIYLVVFSKSAFALSEELFHNVASYVDENYVIEKTLDEYGIIRNHHAREPEYTQIFRELSSKYNPCKFAAPQENRVDASIPPMASVVESASNIAKNAFNSDQLKDLLAATDAGFTETLLKLIDKTGKKDSDIYKKANIDRKLFSKIRNNLNYKPTKPTALAFAIALELDLDETKDFIARAGYTLTHSSKFDIIVEYFIVTKNYNVFELDAVLFEYDQPLIGA